MWTTEAAPRPLGRRIGVPTRVLWSAHGVVGRLFDVLGLWEPLFADPSLVSGRALDCGHYLAEEAPDELLAEIRAFLGPASSSNDVTSTDDATSTQERTP